MIDFYDYGEYELNPKDIDIIDFEIFQVLRKNPLFTPKKISEIIGVSSETIRSRITRMKNNNFLRKSRVVDIPLLGMREQSEVEAAYSPYKIGLERIHVFFHGVRTREQFNKLIQLADEHPYTHYRVLCLSYDAILYLQFDIPIGHLNKLLKLLDMVQELNLFDKYSVINSKYVVKSKLNLSMWKQFSHEWDIETKGTNPFISMWDNIRSNSEEIDKFRTECSSIVKFDEFDALLLRELTVNAKCNATELGKYYGKNTSTITRRINKIRNTVISNNVLYYDRGVFDLIYPQIIFGEFKENSNFNLSSAMEFIDQKFPFDSNFITDGNSFIWHSITPPSFAPMISEFAWQEAQNIHVFQLQMKTARTYYFYHENFRGDKWNIEDNYMIYNPLAAIK